MLWVTRTLARRWARVEALDEGEDCLGGAFVEVAGGFVGEEDLGLGDQGAGEADALLLASAELAGLMLGAFGEAYLVEPTCGLWPWRLRGARRGRAGAWRRFRGR